MFLTQIVIMALNAAALHPPVAPTCPDSITQRLRTQLTPIIDARVASNAFSGVVVVACGGKPIFSGAYGMANRARNVNNTLDTRFNLGSMNKMWTSIAIAQLVEQGKVDLEAPVGKYLPELTNGALRDRVRVKHLLTHTSGLGSYFKRGYLRDRTVLTKASDLLRFFVDDSLAFEPGARMEYSNAGFAVLGMIVERVSGMSYYDYMKKNIIARAGMTGAGFITLPLPNDTYATGYALAPGGSVAEDNSDLVERSSSPAGGAYARAADVIAFSRALWSGKLVGLPVVKEFTTGKVDMGGGKYAYGFGESQSNGWRSVGHNGGAPGVGVDFASFPDHDIDIVVLSNVDMPQASDILSNAVSIVTGGPLRRMITPPTSPPPTVVRPPSPVATDRMPDTPVGRRTSAFLQAFSAGESEMATFIAEQMTPSDQSPVERARAGAPMRARLGKVTFNRVLQAEGSKLVVVADTEKAGQVKVTTEVESNAPYRMLPRPDFNPFP